ncbi:hypothetical protein GCM10027046_04480 [Uliginosibacterium flavum]|uniref:PRC-barrel domain-containing protein n=1 Tax=Uliginosibacterium flavum TaxID=1396831 RepID=A0ABV2TKC0_9RHOO
MLHSLKDLDHYTIEASDGDIGHVEDFYFDDLVWVIRYLVVETGPWLASRKVLISPQAIRHPNWSEQTLPAVLTREQVRNSPDIDTDKPISRQHEIQYLGYYGYPYYWDGVGIFGGVMAPDMFPIGGPDNSSEREVYEKTNLATEKAEQSRQRDDDPHLRSCEAVIGYHVHATDGEIGHIQGFLVDEASWAIRYLIVNTSNWWLGHQVIIAPQWFKDVNWAEQKISVGLNRQSVMDSPIYDSALALNRKIEKDLYAHYQRVGYWPEELAQEPEHSRTEG